MTSWNSFARPLSIAALTAAAVFLSACVTQPPRDNSALRNLDNDLAEFRADTELSDRVPLELASAERAVRAAHSEGLSEAELSHRIQLAGKRLEIARAEAFRVQAKEQTAALDAERLRLLPTRKGFPKPSSPNAFNLLASAWKLPAPRHSASRPGSRLQPWKPSAYACCCTPAASKCARPDAKPNTPCCKARPPAKKPSAPTGRP